MKTKNLFFMVGLMFLFGIIKGNAQHTVILGPNTSIITSNVSIGDDPNPFTGSVNYNTFLGALAGHATSTDPTVGSENTFVGYVSGAGSTGTSNDYGNCALGVGSFQASTGYNNIGIGRNSATHVTGHDNIYLGGTTGNNVTGDANVFLGGMISSLSPISIASTVILGDGVGNQKMYISPNGSVGLGLGNFTAPSNRLEINSIWNTAGLVGHTAGLRFKGFDNTSATFTTANPSGKVLSVNGDGDVILVDDAVGSANTDDWHLLGNISTVPSLDRTAPTGSNFLGTTDDKDLIFRRYNIRSGLIQSGAPASGEFTVKSNTAFGCDALTPATNNLTGVANTAVGVYSLHGTTSGYNNTGLGTGALYSNSVGFNNTAVGYGAAKDNNSNYNVAVGYNALQHNSGGSNTALGGDALGSSGTGGSWNVGIGRYAGTGVAVGSYNVFIGTNAGPGSSVDNKLYINSANGTTTTPLIYGDFNTQNLIFNVAAQTASRVKINSGDVNTSGLNFVDLNSGFTPDKSATKFLTVDNFGDVVLRNLPTPDVTCNIYTCDGTLTGNRTVDMANNSMIFDTQENGRIYVGNTTTPVAAAFNTSNFATTTGNYRLYVEGGVLTEKVKVALRSTTDWQDSVFANEYKLMPLKEVETFVQANKHLPGIDSAADLVKGGLDLGEMQSKQMGKIEELTLYVIEQNKALENQNKILEKQSNEIEELKAQVNALLGKK